MIREICRDETFLAQKAAPATADDLATAQDLLGHPDRPQGRLRGHGGQHDRRLQAHHRLRQRGDVHGDVQSRHRPAVRAV